MHLLSQFTLNEKGFIQEKDDLYWLLLGDLYWLLLGHLRTCLCPKLKFEKGTTRITTCIELGPDKSILLSYSWTKIRNMNTIIYLVNFKMILRISL